MQEPSLRMGSSFDFGIEGEFSEEGTPGEHNEKGILEIKNVDFLQFRDTWTKHEDGSLEAPAHIEIQIQHQMLVSGRKFAWIGALIGGNDIKLIRREADQEIQFEIIARVKDFWSSILENREPTPDFAKDAEILSKIYGYAEPGKTLKTDSPDLLSLAEQYTIAGKQATQYEEAKKAIKAQILSLIQDIEKVEHPAFSISAKTTPPTFIEAHERAGFRNFRINWRKVNG